MADTFTPEQRSEIMRRVKGRDTSPERALRRAIWGLGLRGYRLDARQLPGKPDLTFSRKKVAVFVDGCFWHGCPRHCRMPSTRREYWEPKIERNQQRDRAAARALRKTGWRVVRFWEHDVRRDPARAAARLGRILAER